MNNQNIFKRYEIKYLLTNEQAKKIKEKIDIYMQPNEYAHSSIRNIYFDTDNYRLIRASIEKPVYKEKLRVRSYKKLKNEEAAFVELKKKYDSVVYKRRLTMPLTDAMEWIDGNSFLNPKTQIGNEIEYFCSFYGELLPQMFISYERESYEGKNDKEFRITFDKHILARDYDISLTKETYGIPLIDDNSVLMEVKTTGALPLWLARFLSEERIGRTSFSKYGTAYKNITHHKISNYVM